MAIEVFSRVEMKYMISDSDFQSLKPLLEQNMDSDIYNQGGKTYPIYNIYFDTSSNELIRKSLEKPVYKEKLRLRSYGKAGEGDTVYFEIKKKFDGIVYKRRTGLTLKEAEDFIRQGKKPLNPELNEQVFKEIQDLMQRYSLEPKVVISYDRLAYFGKNDSDFRITLDKNILTRRDELTLSKDPYGKDLLKENQWLMEAKGTNSFPLWFARFLSQRIINQNSFSKYGNEFVRYMSNS